LDVFFSAFSNARELIQKQELLQPGPTGKFSLYAAIKLKMDGEFLTQKCVFFISKMHD
jgi:hypothetical protein